jgi:hypothetical protein
MSYSKLAQSFETSIDTTIAYVRLRLRRVGNPNGNLLAKIYSDIEPAQVWLLGVDGDSELGDTTTLGADQSLPDSLIINGTSESVSARQVDTGPQWVRFVFATPPEISTGVKTWIVLEHTGTFDGSNYIQWAADGSSPAYADGELIAWDGADWNPTNKDGIFEVYGSG